VPGLVITRSEEEEPPEVPSEASALFRVVEGEGRWLLLTETEADEVPGSEYYREIYRSPDARPVAQSAQYVYLIRIDVAPDLDHDAFNEWYNGKHVAEVGPAGLQRGKRYASDLPGWPYMALYDMADRDTLQSEELAKVRGFYQFTPQIETLERTVLERVD
jgi:hypothetical protein